MSRRRERSGEVVNLVIGWTKTLRTAAIGGRESNKFEKRKRE